MMDIHAQAGLQCAACHFSQDAHGNGFIYGEVANAIEIGCRDCHGTVREFANLRTSGPAAMSTPTGTTRRRRRSAPATQERATSARRHSDLMVMICWIQSENSRGGGSWPAMSV